MGFDFTTAHDYWFATGMLITTGTLFVLITSLVRQDYKRHPINIDICRCFCDFAFGVNLIIWYADGSTTNDHDCLGYAVTTQFTFMASYLWSGVRAADLHRMIKDPFSFHATYNRRYHIVVWTLCSLSCIILAYPPSNESFRKPDGNDDMFGEDTFAICWIRWINGINWYQQFFITIPMAIVMAYQLYVLYLCHKYFSVGHADTQPIRGRVLQQAMYQILAFFVWWILLFAALVASYIYANDSESSDTAHSLPIVICFATMLMLRGFVLDPMLYLSAARVHLCAGGHLVPPGQLCCRIFNLHESADVEDDNGEEVEMEDTEQGKRLTVHELTDQIKESVIHFDFLRAEVQDTILTSSLRTDVIAAVSKGIGLASKRSEEQWAQRAGEDGRASIGIEVMMPDLVGCTNSNTAKKHALRLMELLTPEDFEPKPVNVHVETELGDAPDEGAWTGVTFYDYCPMVFQAIRVNCGVSRAEYLKSIQGHELNSRRLTSMMEKFSEGRSSSFFYFTHDKRFMVKTVSSGERKVVTDMLQDYANHLAEYPDTFINKIYGLHGIQLHNGEKIKYFIVMESVMWTSNSITHRFDLKGSWVDRKAYKKGKEKELHEQHEAGKVEELMKDEDLKEIGFHIYVSKAERLRMLEQIKQDINLFAKQNVMDYSLLLAIHQRTPKDDLVDYADFKKFLYTKKETFKLNQDSTWRTINYSQDEIKVMQRILALARAQLSNKLEELDALCEKHERNTRKAWASGQIDQQVFIESVKKIVPDLLKTASEEELLCVPFQRGKHIQTTDGYIPAHRRCEGGTIKPRQPTDAPNANLIYYIGIIDITQEWDSKKAGENFAKGRLLCKGTHGISAVEPQQYCERYLKAMEDLIVAVDMETEQMESVKLTMSSHTDGQEANGANHNNAPSHASLVQKITDDSDTLQATFV